MVILDGFAKHNFPISSTSFHHKAKKGYTSKKKRKSGQKYSSVMELDNKKVI